MKNIRFLLLILINKIINFKLMKYNTYEKFYFEHYMYILVMKKRLIYENIFEYQ